MTWWLLFGYLLALKLAWNFHPMAQPWVDPQEKAMALMLSWLTPEQLRAYSKHKYFYVKGSHTGGMYRINEPFAPYNVEMLNDKLTVQTRICFLPKGCHFIGDIMLAQKIGLETNEEHVLNIANDYNRVTQIIPLAGVDALA